MHLLDNFDYIQRTAKHVAESIANKQRITYWAWRIENVFPDDILTDITDFMQANVKWEHVDLQVSMPRQAVHWDQIDVSAYKRIHYAFQSLTPVVREAFNEHIEFAHSNMWKDDKSYTITPHLDNSNIKYALQVYLNDAGEDCGTSIYESDQLDTEIYKFPFIKNTGYIMHNTPDSWHGMMTPGNIRRSLYVNYR